MNEPHAFADVLGKYVKREHCSLGRLAKRTGVPKRTLANWVGGYVRRPRDRMDVVKLARALHLTAVEATELLQSAGYPAVEDLVRWANEKPDRELLFTLSFWMKEVERRVKQPPFQAIADLPHFVGRRQELEVLKKALLANQHVTLYSLEGMGGVGKTTLAAHLVYQLRAYFPDGVLWARMDTTDTMAILAAFAGAYGRDVDAYTDVGSRSQAVRELLADKQALIVLDNALSSADVRPLLPPSGTCAVIITTRRRDLAAARGARRFSIGPFDRAKHEALDLFIEILGAERAQAESTALSEIADLLGHLPLAVDIIASRLAYEPGWSAAGLLARVRQEQKRLDALHYEDLSVRASFNLSYEALPPDLQQFFAALGTFAGEDFGVEAAAYVAGLSPEKAHDRVRQLYGLSLVQVGRPGRYRLHPLLYDYAREKIGATGVFERMVEFFVRYAEEHQADGDALSLETGNLLAALQCAFERGIQPLLVRGAHALAHFLEVRGMYAAARLHLTRACQAAQSMGDAAGLARVLLALGRLAEKQGDYAQAEQRFQEGLILARKSGDQAAICSILGSLGWMVMLCGEYVRAEGYFREGLALARESGNQERICTLLANLGVLADFRGDYVQAETFYRDSLALARRTEYRERISDVLINLGALLALHHRDYEQAEACYRESLVLAREIGYRENVCCALENMGEMACHRWDYRRAEELFRQALALARDLGQRELLVRLFRHLSKLAEQRGQYEQAEEFCQKGLLLARRMGRRVDLGILLGVLGGVATQRGDYVQAEACWREGLALAYDLEDPGLISEILRRQGDLYRKQQKLDLASAALRQSVEVAQEAHLGELAGKALYCLAQVEAARDHVTKARRLGQESLATLEMLAHPMVPEAARWLAELPDAGQEQAAL